MPKESINKKIARGAKPRVHITYEVELNGAIEKKEIPFVAGVLADLSGQPKNALPKVKDRKFVEIDKENFNKVLAGMAPRLAYRVPNAISNDGSQIGVELNFQDLDDFGPEAVAHQVEPIRKLVEARQKLHELANKLNTSDKLSELLSEIVKNSDQVKELAGPSQGEDAGGDGTPRENA